MRKLNDEDDDLAPGFTLRAAQSSPRAVDETVVMLCWKGIAAIHRSIAQASARGLEDCAHLLEERAPVAGRRSQASGRKLQGAGDDVARRHRLDAVIHCDHRNVGAGSSRPRCWQ